MENYKLKKLLKKTNLRLYVKMDKKVIKFNDTVIEKYKFHQHKNHILINNIDNNKIVVSNQISFGTNFFKIFYWSERSLLVQRSIFLPNIFCTQKRF